MFTGSSVQKMCKKSHFDDEQFSERSSKKHHFNKKKLVNKRVDKRKVFDLVSK